jgi:release factor glutamine methyltransferase
MGLDFKVDEHVLIPRPDTEILVETVFNLLKDVKEPKILDIGTGSGAIIVSLLAKIKDAAGLALDISTDAVAITRENAVRHDVLARLEFSAGDLFAPLEQNFSGTHFFDAIVSNPPYIPTADIVSLSPEVRQEPKAALDGGKDGLDFYRCLLQSARCFLCDDGFLAVEIGLGQTSKIEMLAQNTGMVLRDTVKDYSGIDRVLVFKKT